MRPGIYMRRQLLETIWYIFIFTNWLTSFFDINLIGSLPILDIRLHVLHDLLFAAREVKESMFHRMLVSAVTKPCKDMWMVSYGRKLSEWESFAACSTGCMLVKCHLWLSSHCGNDVQVIGTIPPNLEHVQLHVRSWACVTSGSNAMAVGIEYYYCYPWSFALVPFLPACPWAEARATLGDAVAVQSWRRILTRGYEHCFCFSWL